MILPSYKQAVAVSPALNVDGFVKAALPEIPTTRPADNTKVTVGGLEILSK